MYQGANNVNFLESFVHVLNEQCARYSSIWCSIFWYMDCFQLVLISEDTDLIKYRIPVHSAPCYSSIHFILFYSFTACQINNMNLVNSVHRVHRNQGKSGKIWESLNLKTWKIRKNQEKHRKLRVSTCWYLTNVWFKFWTYFVAWHFSVNFVLRFNKSVSIKLMFVKNLSNNQGKIKLFSFELRKIYLKTTKTEGYLREN